MDDAGGRLGEDERGVDGRQRPTDGQKPQEALFRSIYLLLKV